MDTNKVTIEYVTDDDSIKITETREGVQGILLTKVSVQDLLSGGLDEACRLLGENILLFLDGTRDLMTKAH